LRDDLFPRSRGGGRRDTARVALAREGHEHERSDCAFSDRRLDHGERFLRWGWRSLALSAPRCPEKIAAWRRPSAADSRAGPARVRRRWPPRSRAWSARNACCAFRTTPTTGIARTSLPTLATR